MDAAFHREQKRLLGICTTMETGDKIDHASAAKFFSGSSAMPNGISKHLKVSLPDNIEQLIKKRKQQTKLVTIIIRIDGKVSSLNTLFEWEMSIFFQTVQILFMDILR